MLIHQRSACSSELSAKLIQQVN